MNSTTTNQKTGQTWNTEAYATNGRFVANLASDVVSLLVPNQANVSSTSVAATAP